ncbi:hypothetical protein T492DRAFT_306070 [Pavlovales sp. CCMP2436]|nr:hypothetical protein T492DRAFT_306070 [Pavlovales sp. CCMP2436]
MGAKLGHPMANTLKQKYNNNHTTLKGREALARGLQGARTQSLAGRRTRCGRGRAPTRGGSRPPLAAPLQPRHAARARRTGRRRRRRERGGGVHRGGRRRRRRRRRDRLAARHPRAAHLPHALAPARAQPPLPPQDPRARRRLGIASRGRLGRLHAGVAGPGEHVGPFARADGPRLHLPARTVAARLRRRRPAAGLGCDGRLGTRLAQRLGGGGGGRRGAVLRDG